MYYVLQSLGVEKCYSLSIPVIGFYFLHFLWIFMKNTNAYQLTTIDKIFFIYILPPPLFPEEIDKTTRIDNEKKFTSLVLSEVL